MDNLERIALLIDADNTQLTKIEEVIQEVSTHGRIVVKRAYGNWKKGALKNWEKETKRLAIKAVQQFDYSLHKNATDMALVIDAIKLLYQGIYDSFVIVSSDSDFTPLAIEMHESGVYVMGVGEEKTPEAFRNACDEFIYLENLIAAEDEVEVAVEEGLEEEPITSRAKGKKASSAAERKKTAEMREIHRLLKIASNTYQDNDGFVNVSAAGSYIKRAKPDFDARTYGYTKLTDLIKDFPQRYKLRKKDSTVAYQCLL